VSSPTVNPQTRGEGVPSRPGIREYFESRASDWQNVYRRHDVQSVIYQERRAMVCSILDELPLTPGSEVLEIGCGAGLTAVDLALRGFSVKATDLVSDMLVRTRRLAEEAGVAHLVDTRQCDTSHLPYADRSFGLVMAIGVLPWLSSLREPLREMIRVVKPGGYLIVTSDNRYRMTYILHPFAWARLAGIKIPDRFRFWKRPDGPSAAMYSVREFDARLTTLGVEKVFGATLGFGPFWSLDRLLPESCEVMLHRGLQRLADAGVPLIRSAGAQYIALLRKTG
jgi:2-polyprenyl-3-methyl-5-hydroxy-6-metoxy-1,4-benzoquinol methylase